MYLWKWKYLKSSFDETKITFNEIINVTNSTTSLTDTLPINSDDKNIRYKMDYYILHTVLLVIILLFLISFICCHYANRSKQKCFMVLTI